MTNDHHDKRNSHQTRVPLHERGINIDELTFEMVAPEGDKAQCVERPDIFLERVCGSRTFKSTLFLLQFEEVWIGIIPLDPRLPEAIGKSIIAEGNVSWVLDRFGDREWGRSFSSEKYNPTTDKEIPELRFVSGEEQNFVLKLAIALFGHHDGTITFSRNRRPERTCLLNDINVALSDYLVSKLESGEMIAG